MFLKFKPPTSKRSEFQNPLCITIKFARKSVNRNPHPDLGIGSDYGFRFYPTTLHTACKRNAALDRSQVVVEAAVVVDSRVRLVVVGARATQPPTYIAFGV